MEMEKGDETAMSAVVSPARGEKLVLTDLTSAVEEIQNRVAVNQANRLSIISDSQFILQQIAEAVVESSPPENPATYTPPHRRVRWLNGATLELKNPTIYDLRGPQYDLVLVVRPETLDDEVLDAIAFCLRLGDATYIDLNVERRDGERRQSERRNISGV